MEILDLVQGSDKWILARQQYLTASEASAMMGDSDYCSRDELLALKKFGIEKDVSGYVQKFLFDKGHEQEALARPFVEVDIGEDLYPVTGADTISGLGLLASFDGLTMMAEIGFEHKMWNEKLAEMVRNKDLSPQYYWQLEQQLMISKAKSIRFVVSDGTKDNKMEMDYYPVAGRSDQLIAGWKQFEKDLAVFEHVEKVVRDEAKQIMELPSLSISIVGEVSNSNLEVYKQTALVFIRNINTNLQTDEDFINAEAMVKFCKNAEDELEAAKKAALGQTADIDALFKTVTYLQNELRSKRISLNKKVTAEKANIKTSIVSDALAVVRKHITDLDKEIVGVTLSLPAPDFAGAIKGKRNLESMRSAVNDAIAEAKIEANETASLIRKNLQAMCDRDGDYRFLFSDLQQIITKMPEDFLLLVESRINQHDETERAAKYDADRQRVAAEERAKVAAEKAAEKAAENARLAEIQRKKKIEDQAMVDKENREADRLHVGEVRGAAEAGLMQYVTEEVAKKIVMAINNNEIANVTINY